MNNNTTYFGYPDPGGCRQAVLRAIIALAVAIALFALVFSSSGCAVKKEYGNAHYKDSVRTEYKYLHDSIYIDRWHTLFMRGDTIFKTDSVVQYIYQKYAVHDTTKIVTRDTTTVTEYIEKPLSGGSKFLMYSGLAGWIIVGVVFIAGIVALIFRLRNRHV